MKLFKNFALSAIALVALPLMALSQKQEVKMTVPEYITKYYPDAQAEMRRTGIPASIKLAQGILESSFGNSRLSKNANNHFGIKCGNNWNGPSVLQDDDEKKECFRKYQSVLHSYVDHSNFLLGKERYAFLFKLDPKDYKGWANGLQKAGYATNPNYASLLIRLIEDRSLHTYDTENKYKPVTKQEEEYLKDFDNKYFLFNGIKTVIAQPNEVMLDIAVKYEVSVKKLLKYNDMSEGEIIKPGSRIYLSPKKPTGYEIYHRVDPGETMHSISQHEGIMLKALYKKNKMQFGQEPKDGEILCLRKKCANAPKLKSEEDIKKNIKDQIQQQLDVAVADQKKTSPAPAKTEPAAVEKPISDKEIKPLETARPAVIPQQKDAPAEKEYVDWDSLEEEVIPTYKEERAVAAPVPPTAKTAPQKETSKPKYHTVAPQETLYRISSKYGATVDDIKKWNNLSSSNLSIGQKIIVGYEKQFTETAKTVEPQKNVEPEKKPAPTTAAVNTEAASKAKYHTVAPKETLYRISVTHGVTVDDVKKWNKLASNEISIGQKLIVGYEKIETAPVTANNEAGEEIPTERTYHKVKIGETLYSISTIYGINVEELQRINNLPSYEISTGQILRLQ